MTLSSLEHLPLEALRPAQRNARTHSKNQIKQIVRSIERFGFNNPILISDDNEVVAGNGRLQAAKLMNLTTVPVVRLSHLSAAERRAYLIADNKLALNAGWDAEILATELQGLIEDDFDVSLTGFSIAEIDLALQATRDGEADPERGPEDVIPPVELNAVSRPGDVWVLGRHKLVCGDARDALCYERLLEGAIASLLFTDPPFNVPINGHVRSAGRVRHREFAMASGEMTKAAFTDFLEETLGCAARVCRDGTIAFVCMDWRHIGELVTAGREVFSELKNLCVWNKTNAGMGTFYRSKHELVFVFKIGDGPHINNFGLGDTGRYRTNVWDYPGVNSMGSERAEALEMHPTVKPTGLVADAIRDCSRPGDLVLDPFGGSGTTLIAAEICGRSARLIEYDPLYCDVIIRRYERLTGKSARLGNKGPTFEAVEAERLEGVNS
jgi:DNA modification methylase